MFVKEKISTWITRRKESSKRETEIFAKSEGMAEDAKVDDGDKSRRGRSGTRTLGRNAAKLGRDTGASE